MRRGALARDVGRIAVAIGLSVLIALVLGWLVERVPPLGVVITTLALASLGWAAWRTLRTSDRWRSLGIIGGTYAVSIVAIFAINALLGSTSDADRTASGPVITEPAAPSTTRPAPEPTSTAEPTPATTAVATSTNSSSTTATTTLPDIVPTLDDPADCDCVDDLTGVSFSPQGGDLVVDVATTVDSPPRLWLWSLSQPGPPLVADASDVRANGWSARFADAPPGPWALVSQGGDRVPDLGYADETGSITTVTDQGPLAAQLESALATAQVAVPALDPNAAELVASLVTRQLRSGTTVLERRLDESPDVALDVEIVVSWPRLAQRIRLDGELLQSFFATPDGMVLCRPSDNGDLACEPIDTTLPATSAAAIVADPGALVLAPLPDETIAGDTATCVAITSTPDGGPSVGESCWLADGRQARSLRAGVDTVVLVSTDDSVDPALLEPDGGP